MANESKYFNFPICLIDGVFEDKMKVMNDIFDYSIYAKADTLTGSIKDRISAAFKYFGVNGNHAQVAKNGKDLNTSIPQNSPKTSIKVELYFEFYKDEKTEFETATLCGLCAIRSILLFKPYCKLTDNYMLVRMAGKATVKEIEELPEPLRKYTNRYHLDKIKKELRNNWKLKMYGKHTRGFYVSFDLELTDLILAAEKKRKKYIEKNYQSIEAEARKAALQKLYEPKATPEIIKYNIALIKDKPDGSYVIESLSQENIEAIKHIIKKRLLPEIELTLSPDFKNLVLKRK